MKLQNMRGPQIDSGNSDNLRWLWAVEDDPESETLEYLIKRPLYSAALVLDRQKQNEELVVRASGEAKLPLSKKFQIQIESKGPKVTSRPFARAVGFSSYGEGESAPVECWRLTQEGLEALDSNDVWRSIISETAIARVPGPIVGVQEVVFRIMDSWQPGSGTSGLYFVTRRKSFALRVDDHGGVARARVLEADLAEDLSESTFLLRPWEKAHEFEFHWNSKQRLITEIVIKAKRLGKFEIRLNRHDRS